MFKAPANRTLSAGLSLRSAPLAAPTASNAQFCPSLSPLSSLQSRSSIPSRSLQCHSAQGFPQVAIYSLLRAPSSSSFLGPSSLILSFRFLLNCLSEPEPAAYHRHPSHECNARGHASLSRDRPPAPEEGPGTHAAGRADQASDQTAHVQCGHYPHPRTFRL